jgi:hypothetical protein
VSVLECHGLMVLCSAYFQEVVVFEISPNDHETWAIWCHVGIHVDFTSILHSHIVLVPRAYNSVKRTWTGSAISTSESAWSIMVTGSLFLCVEVAMKVCDHCILRSLLGQEGQDSPSSLHTRRWRPKGPMRLSWIKSILHGFLQGKRWIMSNGMPKFVSGPPPRDMLNGNSYICLSSTLSAAIGQGSRALTITWSQPLASVRSGP